MIKSMTGYGRSEGNNSVCNIKIEIKSVNSKYCDVSLRMPKFFSMHEIAFRNIVQEKLLRGKIDVHIDAKFQTPAQVPVLNRQNLTAATSILEQIKKLSGIKDAISLNHILSFNDLVEYETAPHVDGIEAFILNILDDCIQTVDNMRQAEGENLQKQINLLLEQIEIYNRQVSEARKEVYEHWVERFKVRMKDFGTGENNDRIVQEAAIYAEKADISEEISRIDSHISQFRKIMEKEFPCGKKLDFLCQELYREWNTVASKSIKSDIISTVVDAKAAVDSIREQVQNII